MIFTRFLCVATIAVQSLAISFDELSQYLNHVAPNAVNLAAYLRDHKADFKSLPMNQTQRCLGQVLFQADRVLHPGRPLPDPEETLNAAHFASTQMYDATAALDMALTERVSGVDREVCENVEFWIAKYTIERLCERLAPTQEVKRKVTACLPASY